MQEKTKSQFSLSLLVRIFLGLIVVISIGICARSIMQYNELTREAEQLEEALIELEDIRAELIEDINSGTATSDVLAEYQMQLDYIRELLNSSKNKDYIVKIAKDELNLYFADEEIIYNDIN